MPIAVGVGLEEDSTRCMFRGVCGNGEGGREVGEVKDGLGEEKTLEGIKGGLAGGGPIPGEVLLGEVEERVGNVRIIGDESPVEIGETKEGANIFHLGWCGPIRDAIEFDGVHGQLAGFDDHAEVFHLVGGKLAFLEFQVKVQLGHALQDALRALFVEGGVGGVDEEVIHIDNEPSFGDHIAERVVHEVFEGGGGIGESKEHHSWFEEPLVGDEGGFPLMSVLDSYIVVSPPNIEFGEYFSIPQFIYEVRDEGKGVGITDGVLVDVSIVLAGAESSIFLFDEEER